MSFVGNLSASAKHWLDVAAISGAVVAGVSLAQTALVVSLVAGVLSGILAAIRIYDRLKHGPSAKQ